MKHLVFVDLVDTLIQAVESGDGYRKTYERMFSRPRGNGFDEKNLELWRRRAEGWEAALPFPDYGPKARISVRPGAKKFLDNLKADCELFVLTGSNIGYAHSALRASGLDCYFDGVYSTTERPDLSWASKTPWVLVDDCSDPSYKTSLIPSDSWGPSRAAESHFVRCAMFSFDLESIVPLDFYVPLVRDKLTCQALSI
jgi:hypothetical protein